MISLNHATYLNYAIKHVRGCDIDTIVGIVTMAIPVNFVTQDIK